MVLENNENPEGERVREKVTRKSDRVVKKIHTK